VLCESSLQREPLANVLDQQNPILFVILLHRGNHSLTLKWPGRRLAAASYSSIIQQSFGGSLAMQERSVVYLEEVSTASCTTDLHLVRGAWGVCALLCGCPCLTLRKGCGGEARTFAQVPARCKDAANGSGAASGDPVHDTVGPSRPRRA
jgi:hypothetical protein